MASSPPPIKHPAATEFPASVAPPALEYWTPPRRRWKLPPAMEPLAILAVFAAALWVGPALCRVLMGLVRHAH